MIGNGFLAKDENYRPGELIELPPRKRVRYAETRNIVFLKRACPDGSCSHENINYLQSVPSDSDLHGLWPEWISSFHPDASA